MLLLAPLLGWTLASPARADDDATVTPATPDPPDTHAGLPLDQVLALYAVEGRSPPQIAFGTAATGWSLSVPAGVVFVYVAPSAAALDAWVALQLDRQRSAPTPVEVPAEGVQAAWRRGTDFALLRDDNVGIMVQGTSEATEEAARLRGLLVDPGPPWPDPPRLTQEADGAWVIQAEGARHLAWVGGRRLEGPGPRFAAPPRRVVAWDPFGRAAVWEASEENGLVDQPIND